MSVIQAVGATQAYKNLLGQFFSSVYAQPETGKITDYKERVYYERYGLSVTSSLRDPIVQCSPGRRLNYRFIAEEALAMIRGTNDGTDMITRAPNLLQWATKHRTFEGAYGPQLLQQRGYLLETLTKRNGRQAAFTIWERNPWYTNRDVPCVVGGAFNVRDNELHLHLFMRASDVLVGLPYDMSAWGLYTLYLLLSLREEGRDYDPGTLTITAANSQAYVQDIEAYFMLDDSMHNQVTDGVFDRPRTNMFSGLVIPFGANSTDELISKLRRISIEGRAAITMA